MSEDIISVIVPIYNTELYLEKCLKSIVEQTYKKIEIILIDDGSTDKSLDICKKYCNIDNRIKIVHQDRKGVAFSRNIGIENSTGEYITFVDSDDFIENDMIEKMYKSIKDNNSDIVICGRKVMDEAGVFYDTELVYPQCTMDGTQGLKQMLLEKMFYCVSWGKLYKSTLFNDNRFNCDTEICEDLELLYKVFISCKKITYIPDKLYIWLVRSNSITKQKFNDAWRREILICEEIIEFAQCYCMEIEQYAIRRYIRANLSCLMKIDMNYFNKDYEEIQNNLKKYKLKEKKLLNVKSRMFLFVFYNFSIIAKLYVKNKCKKIGEL